MGPALHGRMQNSVLHAALLVVLTCHLSSPDVAVFEPVFGHYDARLCVMMVLKGRAVAVACFSSWEAHASSKVV